MTTRKNADTKFHLLNTTYVTFAHLQEIAANADKWGYNRQIYPELMKEISADPQGAYPVQHTLPHEHRFGERCEPHVRIGLGVPSRDLIFFDVPSDYFAQLPYAVSVVRGKRTVLTVLLDEYETPRDVRSNGKNDRELDQAITYLMRNSEYGFIGEIQDAVFPEPAIAREAS